MMDNAKYHKSYPPGYPKLSDKKSYYRAFCHMQGIPITEMTTLPILKAKVAEFKKHQKMQCELLAEAQGHKVVFTPPYHSDLQPIELFWAKLKGNIGRKYNSNTTMAILKQRLDEEFEAATGWNESIEGMIHKTTRDAKKLRDATLEEEANESDNSEDEYVEDDDNSEPIDSDSNSSTSSLEEDGNGGYDDI
jgi:phosphopantothenoylcysteine synthetase/decarboxylase